jgi:hypothetical protein
LKFSLLQLYKQISPETRIPFRIIETYETVDGLRSRVVDGGWKTEEEAREALKLKENQK